MSNLDFNDILSPAEIGAANPNGIPQAVSMPGATPFTIQGATLGTGPAGSTITTGGSPAPVSTVPANPTAQAAVTPPTNAVSGAPSSGSLADYFARGIIVILGFIFIAMGLNMLRPGTVPMPVKP